MITTRRKADDKIAEEGNPDDKICPVKLTINYFNVFGPAYIGYRVPSCTPKKTPNSNKAVPYSGALSDRKKLMSTLEYDATFYGKQSGKRGGRLQPRPTEPRKNH